MLKKIFITLMLILCFNAVHAEVKATTIVNPLTEKMCDESNLLGCREMEGRLKSGIEYSYGYRELIPYAIKKMLEIGSGLAVVFIIYSAALLMTQSLEGDELVNKAKDNIFYVILGLVFMLLARAIVSIVENLPLG